MDAILDFNQPLQVALLDRVVQVFYTGQGSERAEAQRVVTSFQEHPDAWQRVPAILDESSSGQSKFIALQIMDKLISTRWKVLPSDQQSGIRNFIVQTIIKVSSDEVVLRKEKSFVNKLNLILIAILKQTWPQDWPTFVPELVSSSKSSLSICENNMTILKLLSEEIFDFSAENLTQAKTKAMKSQISEEFNEVYQLCAEIIEKSTRASLVKATLEALYRFLTWMPLGYIFETNLIDNLTRRLLPAPEFRNITLKCLSEIAGLTIGPEYDQKFFALHTLVMDVMNNMVPVANDDPAMELKEVYPNAGDEEQELINNLALYLTNFLSAHGRLLENSSIPQAAPLFENTFLYLMKISQIEEREIFKICLEYWHKLLADLYEEHQSLPMGDMHPLVGMTGSPFGSVNGTMNGSSPRKNMYRQIMSYLRYTMIDNMVKPEEVLVVENDEGEIVREFLKEVDTIVLYKQMREVLVYLTHLDIQDTETIMTQKLSRQIDGSEWGWQPLNRLCWAIGSISGAMNEETEKRFLVTVIKELLGLTEMKRGKDNKAVVASNIMYIVGQYPRFLKAHWKFLKTVVNKNFEFMHESHEGVQDMACDTYLKIAQKCRRHFVHQQSGETEPFIDEIIRTIPEITSDLSPQQVHTFYEATGHMVASQPNTPIREKLIAGLMAGPNGVWASIMEQANNNVDVFSDPETIKRLSNVLKTNVAACTSIGPFFGPQIAHIYMDMLGLYKAVSGIISEITAREGMIATKTPKVRGLRTIKKEILRLFEKYIKRTEELVEINNTLIPPLLDAILGDYNQNIPAARDAEVLNITGTVVLKLGGLMNDKIAPILDACFEPTLNMINQDFTEFPEHRVGFFFLLRAINQNCFDALLALPPPQFKMFMDSIVWGIKHTMRDIADTGLIITLELVNHISSTDPQIANGFYQQYFLSLLQDIFYVLVDSDHKSGFKNQTSVLARLYGLVQLERVQVPLFDPATQDASMTNQRYLREYTVNLLRNAFPHVQSSQITTFVEGLFQLHGDSIRFKLLVRDFLIQLREFSGEDTTDLFVEEQEAEKERKAEEDRAKAMAVPGMLKPSEQIDQDEEL